MYTFDSSPEAAQQTYSLVCDAYCSLFNRLGLSANTRGELSLAEMECYGLGVTWILAAAIEVLSTEDFIHWPSLLAPYQVCLIPPKKGSKKAVATELMEHLHDHIIEGVPQL
ncbi:Putative prolyl-tRNA synthetase, mitochondrial [Heterocephalus glaber]|uniref:Putative prolyl-tRNA synthetase, mitochondrial n=1 Tax=Heterocephalus glaber TaxID=10181 RepID=G5B715_HETGA|nr:Putative prolyl-tRNA synthetase, mitochondrial [Heterocephalus glaber]